MSGAGFPEGSRPLRLVPGYRVTPDGRVFRCRDGRPVRPLTLTEARRFAAAAIEFDQNRMSRQPLGPVPPEQLVYLGEEESETERGELTIRQMPMVQWVRLPSRPEREPHAASDALAVSSAWFAGGPMPAVGDTGRLWYRLEHDGAKVLFHGPSLAALEISC